MALPQRPPPPLRSYTETVQADVDEATSWSLFNLALSPPSHPNPPASSTEVAALTGRARASTLTETEPSLRRRRSTDQIRLPPRDHLDSSADPTSRDGALTVPSTIRRANSTDLLLIVDGGEQQDEGSEDGFSSEDEPFRFRPPSIASTTTSQYSNRRGIRVEDASNRENKTFVKQLSIPTYHTVGSEGSGFVLYDIEIHTLPTSTSQSTLIRAHKRYSAFVRLRADLIAAFPFLRRAIPRLPPKSSLDKEKRRAAQEALKAARLSGKRNYEVKQQDDVYDEVDEEVYRSVVRGRLAEDEFIEEDQGVSGYADNGMDDWDRDERSESDDDDDDQDAKRKERKAKRAEQKRKLDAAAAKRRAKLPQIADGANPYLNPNKKPGAPLPGWFYHLVISRMLENPGY
ncbi:uncharacterized protein JCM15063_001288 [Sporobolomyces koalae]|uniref:uncharacterized protein n=1 Tax=Sporobolomyces koalae TaxID=500713 RepID=UPI0031722EB7